MKNPFVGLAIKRVELFYVIPYAFLPEVAQIIDFLFSKNTSQVDISGWFVWSDFRMGYYGDNDHRGDAHHFTSYILTM